MVQPSEAVDAFRGVDFYEVRIRRLMMMYDSIIMDCRLAEKNIDEMIANLNVVKNLLEERAVKMERGDLGKGSKLKSSANRQIAYYWNDKIKYKCDSIQHNLHRIDDDYTTLDDYFRDNPNSPVPIQTVNRSVKKAKPRPKARKKPRTVATANIRAKP